MKKAILLVFIFGVFTNLFPYDRLSIVERFTNASCVPCASINNSWYNNLTQNLVASGSIAHVIYNGWWPGSSDPMYLLNQSDNTARIQYYNVNAVPWIVVNGTTISTNPTALNNAVTNGNAEYSPFEISIIQEALSESLIRLRVIITRDPSDNTTFGNVKLRFALTEKTVSYSSPPGSNGESHFYSVCRKMFPNAAGITLTIPDPGESTEVTLEYVPTSQFIASVNFDSLRAVAFVQDDNNKYIYQSYMMDLIPAYVASIFTKSPDIVAENNIAALFTTSVLNAGLEDDSYYVQAVLDGPDGWTGEFTTSNGTFELGQQDLIEVNVGNTSEVSVTINPNGINGFGVTTVTFTSKSDPGVMAVAKLRNVTTTGVDLLVVDASGQGFDSFVTGSLDNFYTGTYGAVSRSAFEAPDADISNFLIVMWSAGVTVPVFTEKEIMLLENYLDGGKRLFINGQDIGADIFEASGQSQFAQDFFNNYLHANYVNNSGPSYLIRGLDGDIIGDGVLFIIDGTYYDRSPDQIEPLNESASAVLQFGTGPAVSCIKAESENYRVVYFGVGMEQITNQEIRDTLISRIVPWLMEGIVLDVDDKEPSLIRTFALNQNYPNPFNPSTRISYTIAADAHVSLKVYDIMGAEVAELVNHNQSAGNYEINFNASNLSSGIYFYRISAGDYTAVRKMTLLK